jgi:calcineurin-like phosphoesterase family protein
VTTWFTSDHHFGHKNIIGFSGRPFASIEEMNEELMRRWNAVVKDTDTVFHLGDLSYRRDGGTADILRRLNGKKFLVPGNHDTPGRLGAQSMQNIVVLPPIYKYAQNGVQVLLCHYPIESWGAMRRGVLHLHGHSHGNSRPLKGRLDVGVDCWDYAPISFEEAAHRARGEG